MIAYGRHGGGADDNKWRNGGAEGRKGVTAEGGEEQGITEQRLSLDVVERVAETQGGSNQR